MNSVVRIGPLARRRPLEIIRNPRTFLPEPSYAIRLAGHAKWQNIKGTKEANDVARGQMINRIVLTIRKAIITGGRQTDPKLNAKLAAVLAEGSRANVPKATMERAIERAANMQMIQTTIDIQGPEKSSIVVKGETLSLIDFKKEVRRAIKPYDAAMLNPDSLTNMFKTRGIIRTSCKMVDGKEIDNDLAEEAAIVANAEEVYKESPPDEGWVFITDEASRDACKGELERFRFVVESVDLELEPYNKVDFGPKVYEKVAELEQKLREIEGCLGVYHNVKAPDEG